MRLAIIGYGKMGHAIEAQARYCHEHEVPLFAPADGYCSGCHMNIYGQGGYSAEQAGQRAITRCPYCGRSFVE